MGRASGDPGRGAEDDRTRKVRPAGLVVRRMRHERGWPPRALIEAIADASLRSSGLRETITPDELMGIEERNELIAYDVLCLVAAGLGCDPVDILG